jgi:hypothetical protein
VNGDLLFKNNHFLYHFNGLAMWFNNKSPFTIHP